MRAVSDPLSSLSQGIDPEAQASLREKAERLAEWARSPVVGDTEAVSVSWMNREQLADGEPEFEREVTESDLMNRNQMQVWTDEGEVAIASACGFRSSAGRVLVALHLRDETYSPSRSVRFIEAFQEAIGAESYNFEVDTYRRFAFYRASYDCGKGSIRIEPSHVSRETSPGASGAEAQAESTQDKPAEADSTDADS
jgi:hypothetical protein